MLPDPSTPSSPLIPYPLHCQHTGVVTDVVETPEDAKKKGVKHPLKVVFEDQHGACHPTYGVEGGVDSEILFRPSRLA